MHPHLLELLQKGGRLKDVFWEVCPCSSESLVNMSITNQASQERTEAHSLKLCEKTAHITDIYHNDTSVVSHCSV